MLVILALLAFGILVLPTVATISIERSQRAAWGIVSRGWKPAGQGVYRQVNIAQRSQGRAPCSVVAAAWSSFFIGQWIVPGGLAMLLLLLVMVEVSWTTHPTILAVALSAPSGLALGARVLGLGAQLLSRDFGVERQARRTASWSFVHNGLLIAAMAISAIVESQEEATWLAMITGTWALASVAHALLLRRAARSIEHHASREWLPEAVPP